MKEKTLDKERELINALDALGIEVTRTEITEYVRGDPTVRDSPVTGAEIKLTAYVSYADEPDDSDDSPFRVK